jgi:Spy/CpxP family protein refolding chaperone
MIANDNNRPLTSLPQLSSDNPARARRRFWVMLAIPLAAAALSMSVARAHGFGGGPEGGHGMRSGAFIHDRMQHRMDRLLDAAKATDAQKGQIKGVWEPLHTQLQALHKQERDLHRQMGEAVAAANIDTKRVEQLRQESVQTMDKISSLMTRGMVASAQVLTPEQRKLVLQQMQQHQGQHRGHGEE